MKKILSSIMAVAMMLASFTAVVGAADAPTLTITPSLCSYDYAEEAEGDAITEANEGDYVALLMEFESSDGFAAYGFNVNFDKDVFEYADVNYVVYRSKLPEPTAVTSTSWGLSIVGGSGSNIDESKGPALVVVLKVKEDLKADDYTITLTDILDSNGNPNNCDAAGTTLPGVYAPATIHVNGTKTDEPPFVEAVIDEVDDTKGKGDEDNLYTHGFMTTIKGNSEKITAVDFVLTPSKGTALDSRNNDKEITGWSGLEISGEISASYAINVINIPDAESVSIEWIYTK